MAKITSRPTKRDPLRELIQGQIEARFRPQIESVWQRILRRFQSTVNYFWFKKDRPLMGRIHALNRDAESIAHDLRQIYRHLSKEIDPQLFNFVRAIMDPLLREIEPILDSLHSQNVPVQAKAFQKYSAWVEKARNWIELYNELKDRSKIVDAVVRHQIGESMEMVKRDIQIIHDYQEHLVASMPMLDNEKQNLRQEVKDSVAVYIGKLMNLTASPRTLSLEEISSWKGEIDKRRQKYFEEALETIDELMNSKFPEFTSDEAQEHLLEVCSQIAYLEEQIPEIQLEIDQLDFSDIKNQRMIFSRALSLEENAHRLNLDLRLTPDLAERLEVVLDALHSAKATFKFGLKASKNRKVI